jgi:hypothetical protein
MLLLATYGWAHKTAQTPLDWPVNPYRNFFGNWTGHETLAKTNKVTPVTLTITEDKSHARMVWDYSFGVAGQKGYEAVRKYIVFSPTESKMLMHFDREPETLYDVPGLAAFTQAGLGTLVASETYKKSNYWHVKRPVTATVTFQLQLDTLSYRWDTADRGKTSLYSEFNFTRVPDVAAAAKTIQP